jgi:hypothetical protein
MKKQLFSTLILLTALAAKAQKLLSQGSEQSNALRLAAAVFTHNLIPHVTDVSGSTLAGLFYGGL